jgi:hypothetical protein
MWGLRRTTKRWPANYHSFRRVKLAATFVVLDAAAFFIEIHLCGISVSRVIQNRNAFIG